MKGKKIINNLKEDGIPTAIYYLKPLHLQTAFSHLGYGEGAFPVVEKVA
jgi:UDP-2-acetamido-2-deoxy-ribo-hexuluronate aminotransferase